MAEVNHPPASEKHVDKHNTGKLNYCEYFYLSYLIDRYTDII